VKLISIVTPCYNEEENVEELYRQVKGVFDSQAKYAYEHIFIDNASQDRTVEILKGIAAKDKNVKIIVNSRNFGHIRSPQHALLQTKGDASIVIVSDLQHPPELIRNFIEKWEEGYRIVVAIRKQKKESLVLSAIRSLYYNIINRISETELIKNFNGFGLYDKSVIDIIRELGDPYPYAGDN
jgi:glycosyltransferase involved in cell wall biosynthesis